MKTHLQERLVQVLEKNVKVIEQVINDRYSLYLGDSCQIIKGIPDNSIHMMVYSPPFSSLYVYSNSNLDLGNSRDDETFITHFKYLVDELYRVLIPGRIMAVHCMNLPTSKSNDGHIGIKDFRGDLIRLFESAGFWYHSEICIWKDPVIAMQRTKALGLLHKQLKKDSCMSRQGIPDYLVIMRKPGDNPEPVTHTNESFPVRVWQNYASPIYTDINPSDTLQRESAREDADERHICPLQLTVIKRAIELWSNPNDIILSPFGGIGSEPYMAIKLGRRAIAIELKKSYYNQMVLNVRQAELSNDQLTLDFL